MKTKSAIVSALSLAAIGVLSGCGTGAAARGDWEAELRGALSLDCRNIEHLGYGLHYDIVLDNRQATPREVTGVAMRTTRGMGGGQRGE